jgi:hypothetical protein
MRAIKKTLLAFLILIVGCDTSEKLILTGKLGNDLESRFQLNQHGDKFSGYLIYAGKNSDKISVSGVKNGEILRIEEFNNSDNKLTGTFEGKYDGESFQGFWEDPKKSKRVPFFYLVENKKTRNGVNDTEEKELPKKVKIEYLTFEQYGGDFHERLEAKIGEKRYKITDFNNGYGMFVNIVDVRDFDNDGYDDALIEETCGGTACPFVSLFFCTYDPTNDKFKISDSFGSISEKPKLERWKGKWSVSITSGNIMEMYRADERFILKNGEPVRVEYDEVKPLKAKLEMLPDNFSKSEKRNGKILRYDLDGDGLDDSIIGEYWDRWNSINWKVKFANGKSFDGDGAYLRIGILPSKTNGVHDLVCGLDAVFAWDGNKYKKK